MAKTKERLAWDKLRQTPERQKIIKQKLKAQLDTCFYCEILLYVEEEMVYINRYDWDGNPAPPVIERFYNYAVDHVTPISAGGGNEPENLVICCNSCNSRKGKKLDWEFA